MKIRVKKFKPTSPSLRAMVSVTLTDAMNKEIGKKFAVKLSRSIGRNNSGRITSRFKSAGVKKKFYEVDFKRQKDQVLGTIVGFMHDPNRSANLAVVSYQDGDKKLILAPEGLAKGDKVVSSADADIKVGNCKILNDIPVGTLIHAVELNPGSGAKIARTAGVYAQLMAKEDKHALIRMPSGELRKVLLLCKATIGQVGNLEREQANIGKAGKSRYLGRRPHVRGVAMNPVDHPMGGGEGRTSGGRHPCSPWGLLSKGKRTRSNKRTQVFIVKRRSK